MACQTRLPERPTISTRYPDEAGRFARSNRRRSHLPAGALASIAAPRVAARSTAGVSLAHIQTAEPQTGRHNHHRHASQGRDQAGKTQPGESPFERPRAQARGGLSHRGNVDVGLRQPALAGFADQEMLFKWGDGPFGHRPRGVSLNFLLVYLAVGVHDRPHCESTSF